MKEVIAIAAIAAAIIAAIVIDNIPGPASDSRKLQPVFPYHRTP